MGLSDAKQTLRRVRPGRAHGRGWRQTRAVTTPHALPHDEAAGRSGASSATDGPGPAGSRDSSAPAGADHDPGYFGPGSVTWRIMGDPAMVVAGLRTILLQSLHPLAMDGVARFSNFEADPWGRLVRTGNYLGVTTYGSRTEADEASAHVRGIHSRLSKRLQVEATTGRSYRVEDQELLRWVHVTEIDSFLSVARRSGLPLTDADADRYVLEQQEGARLIGVDPTTVPTTVAGVADYLQDVRPLLRATPASRRTLAFGLFPPMKPWVALATPARPAWIGVEALAFAMLPRWARRLHGAVGLPLTDAAATRAATALRSSLLLVPQSLREGPHRKAARQRLGLQTAFR